MNPSKALKITSVIKTTIPLNKDNLKIFKSTAKNKQSKITVPIAIPTKFNKNQNNGSFTK